MRIAGHPDAAVAGGTVVVTAGTAAAAALAGKSTVGPILAFVGVILVALLTAYFTKRRQADQLNAEQHRLETTLAAEERRQAATLGAEETRLQRQLDHDRQLHDLAELRTIIDEALDRMEVSRLKFLDAEHIATQAEFNPHRLLEATQELGEAATLVLPSIARLTARGQDKLSKFVSDYFSALLTYPSPGETHEDRFAGWRAADQLMNMAASQAQALAQSLVASELPPDRDIQTDRNA
jgi:hypothetical protein